MIDGSTRQQTAGEALFGGIVPASDVVGIRIKSCFLSLFQCHEPFIFAVFPFPLSFLSSPFLLFPNPFQFPFIIFSGLSNFLIANPIVILKNLLNLFIGIDSTALDILIFPIPIIIDFTDVYFI